jgi:hypothetical protein
MPRRHRRLSQLSGSLDSGQDQSVDTQIQEWPNMVKLAGCHSHEALPACSLGCSGDPLHLDSQRKPVLTVQDDGVHPGLDGQSRHIGGGDPHQQGHASVTSG